jgi:exosortase/archaeosortase family protein
MNLNYKQVAIAVFLIALIIMLANSFLATQPNILDTDPSTYIIVPIIMIPLLALFTFKKNIDIKTDLKSIVIGFVVFVIFVLCTVYLRSIFSFVFMSYRLDLFILPLGIAGISIMLFGFKSINYFKALLIYTLFASPILLSPIFAVNASFAQMNTIIVYSIIHFFAGNAVYIQPITIKLNGYMLGIGESCAGIGALIAIIMFLVPVAYLYDGKSINKVYWVLSGFLLLLLLNILRMFVIAFAWFRYGPNASTSFAHSFAGIFIFYISLIVIILIANYFGLKIRTIKRSAKKHITKGKLSNSKYIAIAMALALACSLFYYVLSLNYSSSIAVSPIYFEHVGSLNSNSSSFDNFVSGSVNTTGWLTKEFTISNLSSIIFFVNKTFNTTNPVVLFITSPNPLEQKSLLSNVSIIGKSNYLTQEGLNVEVYELKSNNTVLFVTEELMPYVSGNNIIMVEEFMVIPQDVSILNLECNSYNQIYSSAYDLVNMNFYNVSTEKNLLSAYCLKEKIIR